MHEMSVLRYFKNTQGTIFQSAGICPIRNGICTLPTDLSHASYFPFGLPATLCLHANLNIHQ